MARRRTEATPTAGRPPIPARFRRFHEPDWEGDEERTPNVGTVAEQENEWVHRSVIRWARWKAARAEWAEANGYSRSEMYAAGPEDR